MDMTVDLGTVIAVVVPTVGAITAFVWLKIEPIEKNIERIFKICGKIKSDEELKMLIDVRVNRHEKECRQERISQTGTIRIQAPIHGQEQDQEQDQEQEPTSL